MAVVIAHQRCRIGDHVGHGAAGAGVGIAAVAQVFGDIVDTPGTEAGAIVSRQVRRDPVFEPGAVERLAGFVGTEHVLGRMTAAAMTEAVDDIGTAIPFGGLAGI